MSRITANTKPLTISRQVTAAGLLGTRSVGWVPAHGSGAGSVSELDRALPTYGRRSVTPLQIFVVLLGN